MKSRSLLTTVTLLFATICLTAQSVQYGYTEEYKGANEKTPLGGVSIMAGSATSQSNKTGKFRLNFTTLKIGDRVDADLRTVANIKGYVLFNKEAVEQWTVSGKRNYFRIVLCKQEEFDTMVKNYCDIADKAYKEKLQRERERAERLKREGKIKEMEYERQMKEAEERYNHTLRRLQENAEMVARIDESELDGSQAEILQMAKEGRVDEAVELIRQSNTKEMMVDAKKRLEYAKEQKRFKKRKRAEAEGEVKRLIKLLKEEIKILKLAGGKENYDLCAEKWRIIAEADTTNPYNMTQAAMFFDDQRKYPSAERYYLKALADYERLAEKSTGGYEREYNSTLLNIGRLYSELGEYDKTEEYYTRALGFYKASAERDPDSYNTVYALILTNLGTLKQRKKETGKAMEYTSQAAAVLKKLTEENPDAWLDKYAKTLGDLIAGYKEMNKNEKLGECYSEAMEIYRRLAEKDPAFMTEYVTILDNSALYYQVNEQSQEMEECRLKANEIKKALAKRDPDTYAHDYGMSSFNLGSIYENMNQIEKSEYFFTEALNVYRSLVMRNRSTYSRYYMALLFRMSYYPILIRKYADAERYGRELLRYDPMQTWVNANLVSALLFQGKYDEAKRLALKIKGKSFSGQLLWNAIISDLKHYEEKGLIPEERKADVERMRSMLKKSR